MVVALLVTLSGTAFTGWLMEDEARPALLPSMPAIVGPAWAGDDGDGDERDYGARDEIDGPLKEVHETRQPDAAAGRAACRRRRAGPFRHRENLARAMVTGDKRAPGPGDIA